MALIEYLDKVALENDPEVAAINKVTDDDMNEIKNVVNENFTNEITIGDMEPTSESCKIWIDTDEIDSASSEIEVGSNEPTNPGCKLWIDPAEVKNAGSELHVGKNAPDNNYQRVWFAMGKNLIDLSSMLISGGYSDTEFVASSNYITIQYIQVKPNTTYTLSTNLSTSKYTVLRIIDFDNNKTFIRRSGGIVLASSNTFTTSSDAYYLALCFYTSSTASTSDITQAQLEKGNTTTTYEEYVTPTINVDGEDIYSMPVVLYNNSTGSNANIILSDKASNYNMISIDYFVSSSARAERKFIPYPQNKTCYLSMITPDPAGRIYINARSVTIQGTAINTTDSTRYTNTFINGSAITQSNSNEIYITKVLGYK